jgi:hypothetical protein
VFSPFCDAEKQKIASKLIAFSKKYQNKTVIDCKLLIGVFVRYCNKQIKPKKFSVHGKTRL